MNPDEVTTAVQEVEDAVASAAPESATRRTVSPLALLRQRRFRHYVSAFAVSVVGDGVSSVAIPLIAILVLRASAADVGYLSTLTLAPSLLCALNFGVWADRVRRQNLAMVAADLGRCVLLLALPLSYALGGLGIVQLGLTTFGVGVLSVWFTVNDPNVFVSVVDPDDYVAGQSLVRTAQTMSALAGPSVGGLLVQILSAPVAVIVDAASYLGSALLLVRIGSDRPPPDRPAHSGGLGRGLAYLWRTPAIRRVLSVTLTVNFFNLVFTTVLLLYLARGLGIPAYWIGLVLGVGGVGGIVAAGIATPLSRRIGLELLLLCGCATFVGSLVLVPLATGPLALVLVLLFVASMGSAFGRALVNVSVGSIFMSTVPAELRARVRGAFQFVSIGLASMGGLVGGWLGGSVGLHWTLWIGVLGPLLTVIWLAPIVRSQSIVS